MTFGLTCAIPLPQGPLKGQRSTRVRNTCTQDIPIRLSTTADLLAGTAMVCYLIAHACALLSSSTRQRCYLYQPLGSCGYRASSSSKPQLARFRCLAGCDYDLCEICMAATLSKRGAAQIAALDGFLYLNTSTGGSLLKLGSGLRGTMRAAIYNSTTGESV
jgi:hypothetical protein